MFKIGDKVKYNGLFGSLPHYDGQVFEVASEPWQCGENQLVKVKGERGAVRVDCLEKVITVNDEEFYTCHFCKFDKFKIKFYNDLVIAQCLNCHTDHFICLTSDCGSFGINKNMDDIKGVVRK